MTWRKRALAVTATVSVLATTTAACSSAVPHPERGSADADSPWHTRIVATTFWVGEVFDANVPDGSQMYSAYDEDWYASYGGCDGTIRDGACETEPRTPDNDYFPTQMTPRENPFYLDLPFDDVNNPVAASIRLEVVPWAGDPDYRGIGANAASSLMKNRWVELVHDGRTCYGQVQDAGPGEYDDAEYVFGVADERPKNRRYGGAGMDVSPALNACLGFAELNGVEAGVSWRFVESGDVPDGPWNRLITTSR